jgi:hypothetical protein
MSEASNKGGGLVRIVEVLCEAIAPVMREYVDRRLGELALRMDVLESRAAELKYCGSWNSARSYKRGNFTTSGGSLWHAEIDSTGVRPGDGDTWKLAVKSGQPR